MVRSYEDYSPNALVTVIISEIVTDGASGGWKTKYPQYLDLVQGILGKFNVYLVHPEDGRWERCPKIEENENE